jgi:hypothetical protein
VGYVDRVLLGEESPETPHRRLPLSPPRSPGPRTASDHPRRTTRRRGRPVSSRISLGHRSARHRPWPR